MAEAANYAFLHGGGQGGWVWQDTLSALKQQTEGASAALALDVPGCGMKRERRTESLQFDDVARELLADLENSGMRDIVLVGHSQAGNLLPVLGGMRPDLIRRLVYVACSIPLPGQTVIDMMGTGVHGSDPNQVGWPADSKTGDMGSRHRAMFCNDMNDAHAAAFMTKAGKDAWPMSMYRFVDWDLDSIGVVPAAYVLCLRDGILPVEWQETFATRFKADRLIRVDAGHQVMKSRPHTLAEILRHEGVP